MVAISRVRVEWSGFIGGPGISTFYCLDASTFIPALQSFLTGMAGELPPDVHLQIQSAGDIIEDGSGALGGSWDHQPQGGIQGTSAGAYSAPSGFCVTWLATTVLDGHRVKGRTFFVPMGGGLQATDGTVRGDALAGMVSAAGTLVTNTAGNMVIWHRPRKATVAVPPKVSKPYRPGGHAVVTGSRVSNKVAVLRSRRD